MGGKVTDTEYDRDWVWPPLVTVTPKLKLPTSWSCRSGHRQYSHHPAGSVPEVTAQEYVPMPPVAVKVVVGYAARPGSRLEARRERRS